MFRAAGIFVAAVAVCAGQEAFEVASIRPHVFRGPGECGGPPISGSRVTFRCLSLRILIQRAYGIQDYQISGGPAWVNDSAAPLYDISARAPEGRRAHRGAGPHYAAGLLADRFQLKIHRETRELPIYALVIGKGGPKFKEARRTPKARWGS